MDFVDTHCHIQSAGLGIGERQTRELWAKAPELSADTIINNASEQGVNRLICVGCDLADSTLAVDFVKNRETCWASIGLHPHEAEHYAGELAKPNTEWLQLAAFEALLEQPKVVAIGECGLDLFYTHSPKEDQLAVLRYQIELAIRYQLPLIFHVREAFEDFWPLFDELNSSDKPIRGVLHSFTDSVENLQKAIERGLYIGVNGIVTFAKDPAQLAVYRDLPISNLLLETDAPFLTPTPYRGTINESKQVRTIADFVANLRGESLDTIAATTTASAHRLFGI